MKAKLELQLSLSSNSYHSFNSSLTPWSGRGQSELNKYFEISLVQI